MAVVQLFWQHHSMPSLSVASGFLRFEPACRRPRTVVSVVKISALQITSPALIPVLRHCLQCSSLRMVHRPPATSPAPHSGTTACTPGIPASSTPSTEQAPQQVSAVPACSGSPTVVMRAALCEITVLTTSKVATCKSSKSSGVQQSTPFACCTAQRTPRSSVLCSQNGLLLDLHPPRRRAGLLREGRCAQGWWRGGQALRACFRGTPSCPCNDINWHQ